MIKRNKPLLLNAGLCLALTLVLVAAVELVLGIRYTVNDDSIISNIAAGAYGGDSWRLVYVNILVGFMLRPFYWLAPGWNWFVITLVGAGVLCFTALGTLLLNRLGRPKGLVLFAVLLLLGGVGHFATFHYVRYGGLFLLTGFVLVMLHLGNICPSSLLGLALVFTGSLYRFDMLPAVAGLAFAGLLAAFLGLDRGGKKRAMLMGAAVLVCIGTAKLADTASYRADAGWAEYLRFNAARTEISDYKLQFATHADVQPLGLSETDFATLEEWAFYDPEVFPTARVEEIAAALPGNSLGGALANFGKTVAGLLHSSPEHLLLGAVLLGWLLLSGKKRWPVAVGTLAVFFAEVFYLQWRGRYPERIDAVLVLALAVFLALQFEGGAKLGLRPVSFAACLLALAMVPGLAQKKAATEDYWLSRPPHADQFNALSADKQHLYLLATVYVDAANGYSVWHPRQAEYFSNIVFVGSWLMQAPTQQQALAAYGVQNPYADARDNPNVLFADYYYRATKELYLQQHYSPAAQLLPVEEYLELNTYMAVTE